MAGNKPGPAGKGDRHQLSIRVPKRHYLLYEEEARAAGLSLCDYMALVMARAHALEDPEYLRRATNQLAFVLPGLPATRDPAAHPKRAMPAA
jgi:hypothetical protein